MKSVLVCTLLLLAAATSFSQQIDSVQLATREMYLSRSRHQMTAGLVMLAGGGTMIIVGVAKFTNELTFDFRDGYNGGEGGAVLSLVGLGSMLCSVPLFIASARNKRKASKLSTGLTLQRTIVPTGTGFVSHAMPALSLQFHF